jgi:hypothetical protein
MNNYLIPANSKKSQLIFNIFRPIDLIILLSGGVTTLLLMFLIQGDSLTGLIIKLMPIGLCTLLVMPVPYYHNVLLFIREAYMFYFSQRTYRWRGWCAAYGFDETTKN